MKTFSLYLKQNASYYLTSILTVSTTETPCPLTVLFTNHPFASALSTAPHQASINHLVSVRLCDYEQDEVLPLGTADIEVGVCIDFSLPDVRLCAYFLRHTEAYAQV